jgi:transcriptional regulator with XRE-family HTH domain
MSTGSGAGLGAYLRHRRAIATPPRQSADNGTSRRRVSGLRRQEVAEAAGISIEYYIRLEQGRVARPSREVLAALTRAFALADGERDHLFRLAHELPPEPPMPDDEIRPGLLHVLERLGDTVPVTMHDGRLELLARNAAATELLGPVPSAGTFGRNIVHQGFAPGAHRLLGHDGTENYNRWATAELRAAMGRYPDDEHLRSLHGELAASSATFRRLWDLGEATTTRSAVKRVHHVTRGWLSFRTEMLHDAERDHWMVIYAPLA